MDRNQRTARALVAVGILSALVASGCSEDKDTKETTSPRAAGRTISAPRYKCVEDDVVNDDDEQLSSAFLTRRELPSGTWTSTPTAVCGWALSGHDLLSVPQCAAVSADPEAAKEPRSGNARTTWTEAGGIVQIEDRLELFLGPRKPTAVQSVLTSPRLPECLRALVRRRAAEETGMSVRDIAVTRYDPGIPPTQFVRTKGTSTFGVDFIGGATIRMTIAVAGTTSRVAIRAVWIRLGGGLGTVTLSERAAEGRRPNVDNVDLVPTVRAAATHLLNLF